MGEVHVGLSWPGAKHKRAKKKSSKAIVKLTGLRCPPKSSVLSSTVMPDSRNIGCYEYCVCTEIELFLPYILNLYCLLGES